MRVGAMKEEKKIRKKIKIEDLLPRDPIRVDLDAILGYVKGKTILVTGGGGSIGSEICRQLAGHDWNQFFRSTGRTSSFTQHPTSMCR